MHPKTGVFLDKASLGEDLDLKPLLATIPDWQIFDDSPTETIVPRIANADIVVTNKIPLDKKTLQCAKQLKLICVTATGVDNVDLATAQLLGIRVCNVPGYAQYMVAQHTFALLLALASNLINYGNAAKDGRWTASGQFCLLDYPMVELFGKTLGIVGFGATGQRVAQMAHAFGMHVTVADSFQQDNGTTVARQPLHQLLQTVDVLSLHCPLTPKTQHLIGAKELRAMKPSAFLINTARGGLIDETALLTALQEKWIAGAALDVLSTEPPHGSHPLLTTQGLPLMITPHCAWGARETRQRLLDEAAQTILAYLAGQPRHCV